MATSFSGGRSRSTRREPPTMGNHFIELIQWPFPLKHCLSKLCTISCDQEEAFAKKHGLSKFCRRSRDQEDVFPENMICLNSVRYPAFRSKHSAGVPGENHRPWAIILLNYSSNASFYWTILKRIISAK
jgi:hypothetical protein